MLKNHIISAIQEILKNALYHIWFQQDYSLRVRNLLNDIFPER